MRIPFFMLSYLFAGFSFTSSCYASNEHDVANDLYEALMQFFILFPGLRSNDFYVAGESYGGKFVPAISYEIHAQNTANIKAGKPEEVINLQVGSLRKTYFYIILQYYNV